MPFRGHQSDIVIIVKVMPHTYTSDSNDISDRSRLRQMVLNTTEIAMRYVFNAYMTTTPERAVYCR